MQRLKLWTKTLAINIHFFNFETLKAKIHHKKYKSWHLIK
jgi:hypothetical protein